MKDLLRGWPCTAQTRFLPVVLLALAAQVLHGQIGLIPVSELAAPYLGVGEPGLYPGGSNQPSGAHLVYGQGRAAQVVPRAPDGSPSADGWIGLVAVGMSNTNQEWSRFERESDRFARHAGRIVLVDAAQGGVDAPLMDDPADSYWTLFDRRIATAGLTLDQVQVVWLKQSVLGEVTAGQFPVRMEALRASLRGIVAVLAARCPQLQLVFLSSRLYAGYSATREPFAYETAFAFKGLIQDQLDDVGGLGTGPWLGWGPYLWADGPIARGDGLAWLAQDLEADGVHPAPTGEWKVGGRLEDHFAGHPLAISWYPAPGDVALALRDAEADAEVDPAQPDANFGSSTQLRLDGGRRVFLRFDLSGVSAPVLRAKLSLLVDAIDLVPASRLYAIAETAWDEHTLTWNTAPPLPAVQLEQLTSWSRGAALGVDVTGAVQTALAGGATRVAFALATPSAIAGPAPLHSREGGEAPRLVLTLDAPGSLPPIFVDSLETGDLERWQ
ncbi:MAG: DNRLRE domain-containing protein [Thermoanaerobaculia bacterium]